MEDVDKLRREARARSLESFVAEYRGYYLVKAPLADTIGRGVDVGKRSFETEHFSRETLQVLQLNADERASWLGEWAPRWMVLAVRKRTDVFPDRISIGRTKASDIPLGFAFVSKLQAHLYLNDNGTIDVVDRSSNGMRLDRKELPRGERRRLYVGCRLELGPLELDLMDATSLYQVLKG